MSKHKIEGVSNGVLDFIGGIQHHPTVTAGSQIASNHNQHSRPTATDNVPRKRNAISAADKKDKIFELEEENNKLKEKENLLQSEVTKMQTKLRRIEALMRSKGNIDENSVYDANALQRDLQKEYDNLLQQNEFTREKVRKLNVIKRGLDSRPATAAKPNKYANVPGKLEVTHTKVNHQYTQMAEDLRKQLVVNEREILTLQTTLNKMHQKHAGMGGAAGVEQIRQEIQEMFSEIRNCNTEIESLNQNFASNENIFKQSKNYTAEIQKKIRETSERNEMLKLANSQLEFKSRETMNLEAEIQNISEERDKIERSIRNVTSEPFIRKEEGQSMQARLADLQEKINVKTRIAQQLQNDLKDKTLVENSLRTELEKLSGERNVLLGEHKRISEDFKAKVGAKPGSGQVDAMKELNSMEPSSYKQMMTDLTMGGGETLAPAWANLPFLERMPVGAHVNDPKGALQEEINVLRVEKSSFAAELEKAQNLLKLQTDIERENTLYFQQEIKRLTLIEKSSSAKLEELARRADEKQKMIQDIERRINPITTAPVNRKGPYDDDGQSEFSHNTNESEIRVDENILDFKVEDAEFHQNVLATVPFLADIANTAHRSLITLCTIDFYNHTTETTQMGEGLKPNYQTQFSFKNKVDDFYVAFLQKQPLKIDIYISKNNAAVHMGRCEVLLKELIEREAHFVDSRTPLIQNWISIFAIGHETGKPIGQIKYKMRLRKPIQESMRYFREKAEISNMTRAAQLKSSTLTPPKRLVTIQIVAAHNLKFKYSEITDVAPFFYYQFYTFDERYSSNSAGINPRFDDNHSYEVTFDSRAIQYFESENLEIILFDDNAPIAGQQPGAAAGDDMIGVCKIPLKQLVAGCSFHDKYPIACQSTHSNVGQLEVKISVIDMDRVPGESFLKVANQVTELHYTQAWESELILRIARPLGKLNVEIGLLFGVFSRGLRNCTKEDFKYCCLNRLGLRKEISESEIDMFLMGNSYFKDQELIERDDFVAVFETAIQQARHEQINQDAFNNTLNERDNGRVNFNSSVGKTGINQGKNLQVYNESESLQIMADIICQGSIDKILEEVKFKGRSNFIEGFVLTEILKRVGMMPESDCGRVSQHLSHDGKIELGRFNQFVNKSQLFARDRSNALQKLKQGIARNGKAVVQRFESQDRNKDGVLNVDGFKAALLINEIQMSQSDLSECFYLICSQGSQFYYKDWILENFPALKLHFTIMGLTARAESSFTDRDHSLHDPSQSLRIEQSLTLEVDQNKLITGKTKFENYMRQSDTNLSVIFAVLDSDSSKNIDASEFKRKIRAMNMGLDEEEIIALFKAMDMNNDGVISYDELVNMFQSINTMQILRKMQSVIVQSKIDPDYFFKQACVSDPTKQKLSQLDFQKMVKKLYANVTGIELVQVMRHFDKGGKGYVTKNEFLTTFNAEIRESHSNTGNQFHYSVEDIIKPLAKKIADQHVNIGALFDKYDKNHNGRLSAEEISNAMLDNHKIKMDAEEVKIMRDYFMNKYKTKEISKTAFTELLKTKFENKYDLHEAKKGLKDIKHKLEVIKITPIALIKQFDRENDPITIRTFKMAINSLQVLTQYSIDNLTKFMDKNNDGFIAISEFNAQINSASALDSTQRSGGTTRKWN